MKSIYELLGVDRPFDPHARVVTSWALPPLALAGVRLLLGTYCFVTIWTVLGLENEWPSRPREFSYFTFLSYWGLMGYLLVTGFHTLWFALSSRRTRSLEASYPLQRWPRPLQAAHRVLHATVMTYPPLVTLTFWIILFTPPFWPDAFTRWSNVSEHGMNSLFFLFELIFTNTPPPAPFTVLFVDVLLALYLGLAYLTYATQGWYTYSFLDPAEGSAKRAGYICGLLAASIVLWGITTGLAWLRQWLVKGRVKGVDRAVLRGEKRGTSVES